MANDMFGGLGGLGGLGGFFEGIAKSMIPKDTPEGKLLNAQKDLYDLQKQESELLQEVGRQAYEQDPTAWPQDIKLKLIRQNIEEAQSAIDAAKLEQEEADAAQAAEDAARDAARAAEDAVGRCPECGFKNAPGIKFCQECGTSLAAGPRLCIACGVEMSPGTRFCGDCGAHQDA